jgi:crotonobetainyl-CoA:carnitine CoA-transferase CaiB-like acyl-CoA transferase
MARPDLLEDPAYATLAKRAANADAINGIVEDWTRSLTALEVEAACLAAGRNLTEDEWATYIGGDPQATCPQWPAPS